MNTTIKTEADLASQPTLPRSEKLPHDPALAVIFRLLGTLEIIGGVVLGVLLWPGRAQEGYGWQPIVYLPAAGWIATGLIFGCLFFAIAEGLTYLSQISFCCRWSLSFTKSDWLARTKS